MYTRETQKLIYWLIDDYANYRCGNEPSSKVKDYDLYQAKKELKKMYLKTVGYKPNKSPIEEFEKLVRQNVKGEAYETVMFGFVKCMQDLMIKQEDFSLCLNLMSQKSANRFINFMFDFMIDNDIPFRKEIQELYSKQEQERYIYKMLSKRKCAICGKYADLHHFDSVATVGGYEHDTGTNLRLIPLCREHHTEFHNIGIKEWENKYKLTGIYLKEEDIPFFKKIYKNHFKGYKGEC